MQKNYGFTLVELIVVLVILGILAAFAVPRFVDLQEEARNSTLKGLKGSLHGAASMAHGKQLARQKTENASVEVQGKTIEMALGYPIAAEENGITKMIQDLSGFNATEAVCDNIDGVLGLTGTGVASDCIKFVPKGASDTQGCSVEYGFNSTDTPPVIVVNGTNCG